MPPGDPRAAHGDPVFRRATIAWFCAALATFAQLYSPQGLLPAISAGFHVSPELSSWAVGATAIGVAAAVLPWARLSDRVGRMTAARLSAALAAAIGLSAAFAQDFSLLLALRFLCGVALAGVPALAIPTLSETLRPRAYGTAVAAFVSGNALGGLVGRVVSGPVSDALGWRAGLIAVSLIAGAATLAFIATAPGTRVAASRGLSIPEAIATNVRNPGVATILLQGFLLMGAFTVIYNFVGFRLADPPFNLTMSQISWLFYAYALAAIAPGPIWRLATRTSPTAVFIGCTLVVVLTLPLMLSNSLMLVVVGVVVFTAAFFSAHGVASGLVGLRAQGRPGASQAPALYNLSFYVGTGVFSWLGGVVYSLGGWGLSILVCGVAMLAATGLAWRYAARNGGVLGSDT